MTVVAGIVCEYNPFHNGHWLQIRKLREEHGAEAVVCAMSGCFMQRGEPAVAGKACRAMMALSCGADLVIELPALYATRSAYWFALGGVSLLAATGATHLAFGAETDDLEALRKTADRLARPDAAYQEGLRRFLDAGLPFAEAQAKALHDGDSHDFVPSLPNDRLALSYLQVIAERGLPLKPLLIPREGAAYHETKLPASAIASATAIRHRLEEGAGLHRSRGLSAAQMAGLGLSAYIPEAALSCLAGTPLVFPADAAPIQLALLRRADLQALAELPDMSEGLEYRAYDAASRAGSMAEFYRRLKTRRYPLTRLQRMAAHLLIGYRDSHAALLPGGPPYLRILGASEAGRRLLHQIKKQPPVPVIAKTSQIKGLAAADRHAAAAWELELRASAMYSLLRGDDYTAGNPEYLFSPMML
ncbi:MAG: nucleotidyltransferase family protein [Clostridiales bacterium]|nr:nucleotidyltransferase family protein [Clostridiales bacterium]